MRNVLIILLSLLSISLFSQTTYYIDSSLGDDGNTGTSIGSAWQSLNKINDASNGDIIMLKSGETWNESVSITKSVTITKYGGDTRPNISGFVSVTSWTNIYGNMWESFSISGIENLNMVTQNDVVKYFARYPEYPSTLLMNTVSGKNTFTNSLLDGHDYSNAQAIIRNGHFKMQRSDILSHTDSTIVITDDALYDLTQGYGFFLNNDTSFINNNGDLAFLGDKIYTQSTSEPVGIKVATIDTLINIAASNVTIKNINFSGANYYGIERSLTSTLTGLTIDSCNFDYFGNTAVLIKYIDETNVTNVNVSNTHVNGIRLFYCDNSYVRKLDIQNCGVRPDHSGRDLWAALYTGNCNNLMAEYINVKNAGYHGINFYGNNDTIRYYKVDSVLLLFTDGAAVYTYTGLSASKMSGCYVGHGIISNGIGNRWGLDASDFATIASGIYGDLSTNGVTIENNTIWNTTESAIRMSRPIDMIVRNNLTFNIKRDASNNSCYHLISTPSSADPSSGNEIINNVFVANDGDERMMYIYPTGGYVYFPTSDSINYNTYYRPVADETADTASFNILQAGFGLLTLSEFQTLTGEDESSTIMQTSTTPEIYTSVGGETILSGYSGTYIKADGTGEQSYSDGITLGEYDGVVVLSKTLNPTPEPSGTINSILGGYYGEYINGGYYGGSIIGTKQ